MSVADEVKTGVTNPTRKQAWASLPKPWKLHFVSSLPTQAAKVVDQFRAFAEAQGECLHFVAMLQGSVATLSKRDKDFEQLGVSSTTSYNWGKVCGEQTISKHHCALVFSIYLIQRKN